MAMVRRTKKSAPIVRDAHLWRDVTRTITPLRLRERHDMFETSIDVDRAKSSTRDTPEPTKPASQTVNRAFSSLPKTAPKPDTAIEPRLSRRLRRGQLSIDATIDLHGLTQQQAHQALMRFVMARHERGDRTILVITGKGLKKTGFGEIAQMGVLRAMLPLWLSQPPLSPLISGWEPAGRSHGGEGAFYVRLKRGRA